MAGNCVYVCFFFFKQKTAYEMRISDWSSDVCSSDLCHEVHRGRDEQKSRQDEPEANHGPSRISFRGAGLIMKQLEQAIDDPDGDGVANVVGHGEQRQMQTYLVASTLSTVQAREGDHGGVEDELIRSEEHTSEIQSLMRIS